MDNDDDIGVQQAHGNPALFAIILTIIFKGKGWTSKDLRNLGKIQIPTL